ncbi:hypothetical protein [Methylocapsa palsarum]|uniref:hypothetical protein n=1 Tax=Methylocapsa palsarum TaxID=1612308 RepID=UPI000B8323DF|nr:hypothetical protein [Methylocapsa palsarum]
MFTLMDAYVFSGRFALRAAALLLASSACAAEPASPPKPEAPPPSMQAFGAANANCLEWTNSCLVCVRLAPPGDAGTAEGAETTEGAKTRIGGEAPDQGVACSTPGIACQPKEISCVAMR